MRAINILKKKDMIQLLIYTKERLNTVLKMILKIWQYIIQIFLYVI